jgi:addiction module HigA family antidote
MLPKNRPPTHPGEMLQDEFLTPMGMSQTALAEKMGVPVQRINTLINGKRGMTAETAILLSEVFENSEQFWMNLQTNYDLWHAHRLRRAAG